MTSLNLHDPFRDAVPKSDTFWGPGVALGHLNCRDTAQPVTRQQDVSLRAPCRVGAQDRKGTEAAPAGTTQSSAHTGSPGCHGPHELPPLRRGACPVCASTCSAGTSTCTDKGWQGTLHIRLPPGAVKADGAPCTDPGESGRPAAGSKGWEGGPWVLGRAPSGPPQTGQEAGIIRTVSFAQKYVLLCRCPP